MELKVSFPIPYPEPNNHSPPYPIQFLKFTLILFFYLGFCLPSCCFLQVYPPNTSMHFCSPLNVLNAPRHATPRPLICLDLVVVVVVVTPSMKAVLFHILQLSVVNDSVREVEVKFYWTQHSRFGNIQLTLQRKQTHFPNRH